jgi:hypothetical protein
VAAKLRDALSGGSLLDTACPLEGWLLALSLCQVFVRQGPHEEHGKPRPKPYQNRPNAGAVFERAASSQSDPALFRKMFETNYFGAIATTQAMLPLLRNSDFRVIVNVSSELGSLGLHGVPEWPFSVNV